MKKHVIAIMALLLAFNMAACVCNENAQYDNNTQKTETNTLESSKSVLKSIDFQYETNPEISEEDIIMDSYLNIEVDINKTNESDQNIKKIIIRGKFNKTLNSFMSNDTFAHTNILFDVEEVIKGEYEYNQIIVDSYGGIVTAFDYLAVNKNKQKSAWWEKYSEQELKELYIRNFPSLSEDFEKEEIDPNQEYVLFVSYYTNENYYHVGFTKISIIPIIDNKITLPLEQETIKVEDIYNYFLES